MKIGGQDYSLAAVITALGAAIVLIVLLVMGLTVTIRQVSGMPAEPLLGLVSWSVNLALIGASVLLFGVIGFTGGKAATAASEYLTATDKPYLPYVGAVVTTFTGAVGGWFAEQPYVGLLLGLVFGLVTTFAAALIPRQPRWSMATYGLVMAALGGLALAVEGPMGILDWVRDLSAGELSLVLTVVFVSVGVPTFVAWVEHHTKREQSRRKMRDQRRRERDRRREAKHDRQREAKRI